MSLKALILALSLVLFDVATALNLRGLETPTEGEVVGYSVSKGLFKRQGSTCPVGSRECAETATEIFCAPVCCYEDSVFQYGCRTGYYCVGSGAEAGCCPTGSICTGGPPDCVDYGENAPVSATACPATAPVCTTNGQGAPICSGSISASFTITSTITSDVTTTVESTTSGQTTYTISEIPAETSTSTTAEETSTSSTTSTTEIPEETSTLTTEYTTTDFSTTTYVYPTSNTTLTPPPPATSRSSRTYPVDLLLGLFAVAITFFLL